LGIDPGSVITGYGVIESDGRNNRYIDHGSIRLDHLEQPERLAEIQRVLAAVIARWSPAEAAIEEVFVSRNALSALKLGQARGVCIASCVLNHLTVHEYAARIVKKSVVGTGAAAKEQVQHMTTILLNIRGPLQADAADALAIAICHGHARGQRYARAPRTAGRGLRRNKL
jgi:crossover junction endodeoxyribonuclease RuvC